MTLKFYKKIEGVANLAIILVAALLSVVLVKNYLWPVPKDSSPRTAEDIVGKKLPVPEIDWAANGRTLLLVLQTNCRYCTESAPFYKELVKGQSAGSDLKLVAVFPNSVDDAKAYLQSVGVS